MTYQVNDTMKNGATVHAVRNSTVLAHIPNNTITPWATWKVDEDGNAYWGHYYGEVVEASADFTQRSRG